MSKFNENTEGKNKTVNKEGHVAYKRSDKQELVNSVLTTFFGEEKFYGNNDNEIVKNAVAMAQDDPKFLSNLARFARKEFHLRSVSHVLTCIVAHELNSKPYTKDTVKDVVERPDDILEILAYYLKAYGKPLPNGLKKALSEAMNEFNEYQFSKYNGGEHTVKFKDVLKLTHAKPKTEVQSTIFNKILNDNLATAIRWETELSAKGNNKETWETLIKAHKVGYMAMLRNLRNIIQSAPDNINDVFYTIENKEQVLKSKQLPFRFFSAYKAIENLADYKVQNAIESIEKAIEHSIENLPEMKGKTVIAYDVSGSMCSLVSDKSGISCADISALLAVIASKKTKDCLIYAFDNNLYKKTLFKNAPILQSVKDLSEAGGGTSIELPLQEMIRKNIYADRFILISDNMINSPWGNCLQGLIDKYRKEINPNIWVHEIDLQGYGTTQFMGKQTDYIAGWSEKIFDFISTVENNGDTLIDKIKNYDIKGGISNESESD